MDPQILAILQMLGGGGGYMPYQDYSTSLGGYLPMDSGTMGANLNQLQDVASLSGQGLAGNPLVLAALGMTGGDQFGSSMVEATPGTYDGRRQLQAVVDSSNATGVQSWESVLAAGLLEGMSPSQAVKATKDWYESSGQKEITGFDWTDLEDLGGNDPISTISSQASDWHSKLIQDSDPVMKEQVGVGLQALRDMGIPDPGSPWDPAALVSTYGENAQKFVDANAAADAARGKVETRNGSKPMSGTAQRNVFEARRRAVRPQEPQSSHVGRTAPVRDFDGANRDRRQDIVTISGSAADRKNRLDAIAARDTAGHRFGMDQAMADAWAKKLESVGMSPTQVASMRLLAQIQGLAGG